MAEEHIITLNGQEIVLDSKKLEFDESNLSQYLEHEAASYDYYGKILADLEYVVRRREIDYETKFAELFVLYKEQGGSDKLVEAKIEAHPDIVELKKSVAVDKRKQRLVQNFIRAYDKSHDNAQSRGHMLRKEMDKLGSDIRWKHNNNNIDPAIEDIIKAKSGL